MQTGNLFFCGAEIRKQKCFWATRDNRKWKYLFFLSIYLHANKFVFTTCLYSYHETRFAWKFGQNHCPRIKQSPLPVEWNAQTLGFVPGFASAPHCGLNRTRVKIEFYQKNQAEFHFEARGTTCSWLLVAGDGHLVLKRKTTEEQWRSCVIASHSIESFIKLTSF